MTTPTPPWLNNLWSAPPLTTGWWPVIGTSPTPAGATLTVVTSTPTLLRAITPAGAVLTVTGGTPTLTMIISPAKASLTVTGGTPTIAVSPMTLYDTVGTAGSENTLSTVTCSITPTAGDDVIAFGVVNGYTTSMTYGASNLPMKLLGKVLFNARELSAFGIRGVAAGAATITATKTGSGWAQVNAVAYKNSAGFGFGKQATGSGTALSQAVVVPSGSIVAQSFTNGDGTIALSSPSGGTNHWLDSSGVISQTIGDTNANVTMSATSASTSNWGGLAVPLLAVAPSGPFINNFNGTTGDLLGGSGSLAVTVAIGDYVYLDMVQDRAGTPSTITCDGVAMTLVDTQTFTAGGGTGFLTRYRSGAQAAAGSKTVAVTSTGGGWWNMFIASVSGVTTIGSTTKTTGTATAPSQAVTGGAGKLIMQGFGLSVVATLTSGGAILWPAQGSSNIQLLFSVSDLTTTFGVSNSVNWAAMATVLS